LEVKRGLNYYLINFRIMPYTPTLGTRPEDLSPNAFQPTGNFGFASQEEVYTLYDRPIPEQTWLFQRHAKYTGFATMLRLMGFGMGSSTPTVGHFEKPWIHDLLHVGAVVTPAVDPGDSAVISIDASAHYDASVTVGGNARQATYPIVGDVIELDNRVQVYVAAKDISVTPNQLTLTPLKATDDISGTAIEADDKFAILYNLHAESSGLPAGRVPRIVKYTNTFGVIKHSFGSSGFELTNSVYHETVPGQPGSAGEPVMVMIKDDEIVRYEMAKSGLLLHGRTADNLTATGAATESGIDMPITSTEGFIDFAVTSGTVDTYTVGSYALADFNVASQIYLDERSTASNDILGWLGGDIFVEIEDELIDVLDQNPIYAVDRLINGYADYMNSQYHQSLTREQADAAIAFGYTALRKNGFMFHFKRLSEFNDKRRAGADAYNYSNWAIWQPVSWTTDALSGNNRATVGYEYKQLGNYSRENVFGSLPGAGVGGDNTPFGKAVSQYDTQRYFLISHCAFHGAVGNGLVVQNPA
jgi:hypothetical protein